MKPHISIIIPAWNEERTISRTLRYLQESAELAWDEEHHFEIIVVDDGSRDKTYEAAWPWVDELVKHRRRRGKGAALQSGVAKARGEVLLFLDADLQASVGHALTLVDPLLRGEADMVIAKLPPSPSKGGFGLVRSLARRGVYRLSGYMTAAPLSGQRAVRADCLRKLGQFSGGFGVEVAMTIDAARRGLRIVEVDAPISHRGNGAELARVRSPRKTICRCGEGAFNPLESAEALMSVRGWLLLLDLFTLAALGYWLQPHVKRFLAAHGRTEPNYLGAVVPRGMGIVLWLLIGGQELLFQGAICIAREVKGLSLGERLLASSQSLDDFINFISLIEESYRGFAFAATVIFLLGWTDDLIGDKSVKGLKGHFRYCRETGTASMGAVKAIGAFSAGVWLLGTIRTEQLPIWEMGLELFLLTMTTNAANLLDVRPGRSLKAFLFAVIVLLFVWKAGEWRVAAPLFPVVIGALLLYKDDVHAKVMLGDAGSNLLGFALGYGFIIAAPLLIQIGMLITLCYMHHQAEKTSLTSIIERNRLLHWLDQLDRT